MEGFISTLRRRTWYGHVKTTKQSASASSFATVPVLFCRDYQRTTCSFPQDHYGLLRGKRKWLRHICADCWVKVRTQALHPERSKEGPSSTNSGVKKTNFLEPLRSLCRSSWWRCFLKWLFRFRGFWSWNFRYETWTISWQCKTSCVACCGWFKTLRSFVSALIRVFLLFAPFVEAQFYIVPWLLPVGPIIE